MPVKAPSQKPKPKPKQRKKRSSSIFVWVSGEWFTMLRTHPNREFRRTGPQETIDEKPSNSPSTPSPFLRRAVIMQSECYGKEFYQSHYEMSCNRSTTTEQAQRTETYLLSTLIQTDKHKQKIYTLTMTMTTEHDNMLKKMCHADGFVAALDQSGGSSKCYSNRTRSILWLDS